MYIVLVSYPPFLGRTSMDIKRKIIHGIYEFDPEYWGDISEEAIDFVKRLLTVDMNKRMTAEVSLLHPWVKIYFLFLNTDAYYLRLFSAEMLISLFRLD